MAQQPAGESVRRGPPRNGRAKPLEARRDPELEAQHARALSAITAYAIISADGQGTIISWNQGAQRMFGYSEAEVLGQNLTLLMPERLRSAHQRGLARATARGNVRQADRLLDLRGLRKDGAEFPLELSLTTWTMGGRRFYSGIARDLTVRKQVEAALERLSYRHELILNAAGEGIYGVDLEGRVTFANPAALRLTGYDAADLIGHSAHDSLHHSKADGSPYSPDDCPLSATLRDGAIHDVASEVYWRKDGSSFPVEYVSAPIYDQSTIAGAVVAFKDISERRHAEDERARLLARERAARTEAENLAAERAAILGQIADGVVIADAAGRLTFANEAARRHYGIHTLGVPIAEHARLHRLSRPDGRPWPPDDLPLARAVYRGDTVIGAEMRIQRPDGQEIAALASATPLVVGDNARSGAVMTLHDVSARRALDRQKDDFLANVSHDLRTPLAAIMTSIGVVLANEPPDVPEPLHRMLANIDRAAERLAELVDNLLELTRLQAGRTRLRREPCDLRELARRLAAAIEPLAQARDQRVELEVPPEPVPALVDAGHLERALLNLLSNAQKYGRSGGLIRLRLERHNGEVAFAVADDGPGIAAADQAHIFERFFRSESEATHHREGSGLGLPIARAMVELHGGRIWVDSTPGHGATFWIALPSGLAATACQDESP